MDIKASILAIGTILSLFTPSASACSLALDAPTPYTMEETLYAAPIVIYGKDIGHTESPTPGETFDWVFFEVYCILKDSSGSIKENPNNVTLDGGFVINTCMHTYTEAGKEYLIALKESKGKFSPWEPRVMHFPPTEQNLATAYGLCGLQNVTETGIKVDACPKKAVKTQAGCKEAVYSGAGHVQAVFSMMTMAVAIASKLQGSY